VATKLVSCYDIHILENNLLQENFSFALERGDRITLFFLSWRVLSFSFLLLNEFCWRIGVSVLMNVFLTGSLMWVKTLSLDTNVFISQSIQIWRTILHVFVNFHVQNLLPTKAEPLGSTTPEEKT
jgi:hypothetical protein